jgi:hypothetical protein
VVAVVLLAASGFGYKSSVLGLALLALGTGAIVLLQQPALGPLALIPAALIVPLEFGTGTEVALNPATLLVPALLGVWGLDMMRRSKVQAAPSRTNLPLALFLLAGLVSLAIGIGTWDPAVPRSSNFLIVQLAQWAIFAFAAFAFWLPGNLFRDMVWLRRLVFLFLGVGGCIAILFVVPATYQVVHPFLTAAVIRAPFWMLLAAAGGGQLLFNRQLDRGWRIFILVVLGAVALYAFYWNRDTVSNWVGVLAVAGILGWLRWPRLRWPALVLLVSVTVSGVLFSAVYNFAGGDTVWLSSGGSRLVLIGRVIEVTMHNPITGLGPAAYRAYAGMEPLPYLGAYWIAPLINSHNNYVDLFSQTGLLGLGLFLWFAVQLARLALCLRTHFSEGFAAGYVNGMLAVGGASLVLMMFADWLLPFVYNIGFQGFQASVLVWLFMGGLVALDQGLQTPSSRESQKRIDANPRWSTSDLA